MRTVYKYPLSVYSDTQVIDMPRHARVIHVGVQWKNEAQDHEICIWAEVHSDHLEDLVPRRFDTIGTGHIILRGDATHVGTVQMPPNMWGNVFVWHIYEVPYDV